MKRSITRIKWIAFLLAFASLASTLAAKAKESKTKIAGTATDNSNSPILGVWIKLKGTNPADIESIDVLKDAASAAIYGSQSANG